MNFFRRRQKRPPSNDDESKNVVFTKLYNLLRSHGDAILRGDTKLSLTTQILILLNASFQKITEGVNQPCFQVANHIDASTHVELLSFIFDFIQKVLCLKLISGVVSSDCPYLSIHYFKSLQVLEIRKIPIKHVKDLHAIRRQLRVLICFRSTNSIEEVVLRFGKGNDELFILPVLSTLDLSYNMIKDLNDDALKLLPMLDVFNLSFNCITCADSQSMPAVSQLNLGYNAISCVPKLPSKLSHTLRKLILRNNNISSLAGMEAFSQLEVLDLTANCIIDFQELHSLAYLQQLNNLILLQNPISYHSNYRRHTIQKLSPVKRRNKISLDGKILTPEDLCYLGEDVEPVSLSEYIPHSYLQSHKRNTFSKSLPPSSTPVRSGRANKVKVRHANIVDAQSSGQFDSSNSGYLSNSVSPIIRSSNSSLEHSKTDVDERIRTDSRISSRRSSINNTLIWLNSNGSLPSKKMSDAHIKFGYDARPNDHEEMNQEFSTPIASSTGTSHSECDSEDFSTDGVHIKETYSSSCMKNSLNTNENHDNDVVGSCVRRVMSEEYIDHDHECDSEGSTDDYTDSAFLVQNVVHKDDSFKSDEKENLFVAFKLPYLIEKEDDGELRNKLDLNYLQNLTVECENLKLVMRFNLIRSDWQFREYIFDQQEQFDDFLNIVQPIHVKNFQKIISEMRNCECLKCRTTFLNDPNTQLTCPKCHSHLVVDKNDNHVHVEDDVQQRSKNFENNHDDIDRMFSLNFPITENRDICSISTWPPKSWQVNPAIYKLASSLPKHFENMYNEDIDKDHFSKRIADSRKESIRSTYSYQTNIQKLYLKPHRKLSECSSNSPAHSRTHSRQPSHGSIRSKPARSSINTPVISSNVTLFSNSNDFQKCDHRLKLYYTMSVYKMEKEEFLCQIRCHCMANYTNMKEECLLNFSNKAVYIFIVNDEDSDSPDTCLKILASYSIKLLRYISCGFYGQSFSLDFIKNGSYYKFLVGNMEKTNEFLKFLEEKLPVEDGAPVFVKEINPQTVANMNKQVFGLKEDVQSRGERIFNQICHYSSQNLLKTKKIRLRTHQQCFVAKELIDWLVQHLEVRNRTHAVELCESLIKSGVILPVSKEQNFKDGDNLFKFTVFGNPTNKDLDSGFETSAEDEVLEENEINTTVVRYLICKVRINESDSNFHFRTVLLTQSHIFLLRECHHWPLSRLSPPPSQLQPQYVIKDMKKITSIASLDVFTDSPYHLVIHFVNEDPAAVNEEITWFLHSKSKLDCLIGLLRNIWEKLFGIELSITSHASVIPNLVIASYVLL